VCTEKEDGLVYVRLRRNIVFYTCKEIENIFIITIIIDNEVKFSLINIVEEGGNKWFSQYKKSDP